MSSPLLDAGQALAAFARAIAAEAVRASGDVMDGAHATALAAAWDEALSDMERRGLDSDGIVAWVLGATHEREAGGARSRELLHLARCLRSGFAAALAEATDPDTLTDEEEQSLDATHVYIASANGAANRLAQLELEIEGQGRLL